MCVCVRIPLRVWHYRFVHQTWWRSLAPRLEKEKEEFYQRLSLAGVVADAQDWLDNLNGGWIIEIYCSIINHCPIMRIRKRYGLPSFDDYKWRDVNLANECQWCISENQCVAMRNWKPESSAKTLFRNREPGNGDILAKLGHIIHSFEEKHKPLCVFAEILTSTQVFGKYLLEW